MILDTRIPFKYVLNKVRNDVIIVFLIGLATNVVTVMIRHVLPDIPITIPTFLGTAISVLLSFKMSQSYDRWWEGRKVWGAIVNDSRSLILQLQSLVAGESARIAAIAYRQIAWCYALGISLRGLDRLEPVEQFISEDDYREILPHNNRPLALLQQNTRDISRLRAENKLDTTGHFQLNETLVRLCDAMGKAERINNTVFPSTYRKFLHFIIYLFVIILSIALKDEPRPFVMLLLLSISTAFFLIEKSAYHLQDPFRNRPSDVPVTSIARTIEINIRQLLGEKDVPQPVPSKDFYIL
jgi:putative membrane protein